MSKVFRRPMFRRGGGVKTMDGIMHGIQTRSMNNLGGTPRRNYGVGSGDIESIKNQMSMIDAISGPAPDHLAQLLISGGLNLVSGVGAGTGSKLGDIAAAYKDPTAQAFQGMAADRTSKRSLAASLLKGRDSKGFDKYLKMADQMIAMGAPGIEGLSRVELAMRIYEDKERYTQQKTPDVLAREEFIAEAKSYGKDIDNKGNPLIKITAGRRIATARRKLEKDNPELHNKVDLNKPYVDPRVQTTRDNGGNLLVEEGDRFRFKTQRVYYDTGTNKWYLFDGEKLIPQ